ncbi:MAG: succinylglutamate desuccinylase/aspartoacylase family protein [Nevskiales bacterium]|nr:succinylglutamate desuccinylase/aspartoacylase family protein [Nevskiales bacterium]
MNVRTRAALVLCAAPALLSVAAPAREPLPLVTLERACALLDERLHSVTLDACLGAGLRTSADATVRSQPILWRDYYPRQPHGDPRRILLIGGIHGDEFSSVSILFQWMQRLDADGSQPFHWRVVPCVNPDGLLDRPATRTNARGVDLNRNFPTPDWAQTALPYWKRRTGSDPRRYPGPAPLSEPETRWLVRTLEQFRPQAVVSVHAPYGVLDYDGPHTPPRHLGYLYLHLLGAYPGSLGNYAGLYLNVPVITLELPQAGLMPSAEQSAQVWADLLHWLKKTHVPDTALPYGNPRPTGGLWQTMLPSLLPFPE